MPLFFHGTLFLFPHVIQRSPVMATDTIIPFHRVFPVPLVFDVNKGGVHIGHPLSHRQSEKRCLLRFLSAIETKGIRQKCFQPNGQPPYAGGPIPSPSELIWSRKSTELSATNSIINHNANWIKQD
ncbi:hypothetical protein C8J56DRAFT_31783 [Mycena floridula]|nr:hypothetical protein C8J56DRAFT_31783 [Mycena floridula]